jgi:hypothetical protein
VSSETGEVVLMIALRCKACRDDGGAFTFVIDDDGARVWCAECRTFGRHYGQNEMADFVNDVKESN